MAAKIKHACCYTLVPATLEKPGVYCETKVRYKVILDDDRNKTRKYNPYCQKHTDEIVPVGEVDIVF